MAQAKRDKIEEQIRLEALNAPRLPPTIEVAPPTDKQRAPAVQFDMRALTEVSEPSEAGETDQ